MQVYENSDYETPVEDLPGILGYSWDGQVFPINDAIRKLGAVDWRDYHEIIETSGEPRKLNVDFASGAREIEIQPYADLAFVLEQVPGLDVFHDFGPPNAGPASGSGYLFFLKDGADLDRVEADISSLSELLGTDLQALRRSADERRANSTS